MISAVVVLVLVIAAAVVLQLAERCGQVESYRLNADGALVNVHADEINEDEEAVEAEEDTLPSPAMSRGQGSAAA